MTVFGIDLGRSQACIAWLAAGGGPAGSATIPPAVRFASAQEVLVGEPALAAPPDGSGPFVFSVYDLLARSAIVLDADVRAFERTYSPEWVAARVLAELGERARAVTGGPVRDVVLAVPVELGVAPIAAQRRAAEEAGLAVRGTILAPIAVCLHHEAIGEGLGQNLVVCIVDVAGPQVCALRVREYLVDIVRVPPTVGPLAGTDQDVWTESLIGAVRTAGATVGGPLLDDLDAVLLAGDGATPDLAARLHTALGIPVRCDAPEAAVADGAARSADFGFLRVNTSGASPMSEPRPSAPAPRSVPLPTAPEREDPEPAPQRREPARETETKDRAHAPTETRTQTPSTPTADERIGPRSQPPPRTTPDPGFTADPGPGATHVPRKHTAMPAGPDAAHPQPVAGLTAERREDRALLTWIWPPDCVTSVVRWQVGTGGDVKRGEVECTRRVYEHEGGFQLRIGSVEGLFTVEALVSGSSPEPGPPSSFGLAALLPAIRYAPAVRGRGSRRKGQVTLTSDTDCSFPAIDVVLARGHYLPRGAHEGEIVHRITGAHLTPRTPLTVQFPLPGRSGPFWLVCFTADPAEAAVELLPESLHRLKVG